MKGCDIHNTFVLITGWRVIIHSMNILGLQKTTLLDYPGMVACTIFIGGCNMRCPFCHNMNIVTDCLSPLYSQADILDFLKKRAGLLDGVCITGGEPTLFPELPDFIRSIKSLGYKVKLDTNGTNPDMIKTLTDEGLIDYIAMDIKSSIDSYGVVCGNNNIDTDAVRNSICVIMNGPVAYEFRTTLVKKYHDASEIHKIGSLIKGARNYYLQSFKDSEFVPDHSLEALDINTLNSYVDILSQYVQNVSLRGV